MWATTYRRTNTYRGRIGDHKLAGQHMLKPGEWQHTGRSVYIFPHPIYSVGSSMSSFSSAALHNSGRKLESIWVCWYPSGHRRCVAYTVDKARCSDTIPILYIGTAQVLSWQYILCRDLLGDGEATINIYRVITVKCMPVCVWPALALGSQTFNTLYIYCSCRPCLYWYVSI